LLHTPIVVCYACQMTKKTNPRKDFTQTAFGVFQKAIEEKKVQTSALPNKNPAAVELGRLGGLKGGTARAKTLTKERRSEIAKKAAATRWKK